MSLHAFIFFFTNFFNDKATPVAVLQVSNLCRKRQIVQQRDRWHYDANRGKTVTATNLL